MKTWCLYKEHIKSVNLINRLEIKIFEMTATIVTEMMAKKYLRHQSMRTC